MTTDKAEAIASELLTEAEACTLATASSGGQPEAATVRFVCDEEYTIYVNTATTYRKYHNLIENPRVALVVTNYTNDIQIEGEAREITGRDVEHAEELYIQKYGRSKYLTDPNSTFFEIDTTWMRVLVDSHHPPDYETIIGDTDTESQ
jgi:uncharacterized pyridoxamine 5'-phosphate oxidase family protein